MVKTLKELTTELTRLQSKLIAGALTLEESIQYRKLNRQYTIAFNRKYKR